MYIGKVGLDLGFYYDINVDLDVFLYNVCNLRGWTSDNNWCSFHENLIMVLTYLKHFIQF